MKVDNEWQWKISRPNEAHLWSTKNTFGLEAVPLHSEKECMWFGITEAFAVVLFFFDQIDKLCPVNVP